MTNKCCGCQRPNGDVDADITPCCNRFLCYDFCLGEHLSGGPFMCPGCGKEIEVYYAPQDVDCDYPGLRARGREERKAALLRIKKVVEHYFAASPHELLTTDIDVLDELIGES